MEMPDIINTLIIPLALIAGQLWLNLRFKWYGEKRERDQLEKKQRQIKDDEWRESITNHLKEQDVKIDKLMATDDAEWRESITKQLNDQDESLRIVVTSWATTMRSDLIHRAHRYIDDLGCASVEEKDAIHAQWEEYQSFCKKNKITNNFIDNLMIVVMNLPTREVHGVNERVPPLVQKE